jgi:DNA-binding transcriptional ArsR family regulator
VVTHGKSSLTDENRRAIGVGELLAVLSDPTRRTIIESLREAPKPVVELARGLPISRPAVSQHLRLLKDAGLVTDRAQANRRIYSLDPYGLAPLMAYLEGFWNIALANYARAAAMSAGLPVAPRKSSRKA